MTLPARDICCEAECGSRRRWRNADNGGVRGFQNCVLVLLGGLKQNRVAMAVAAGAGAVEGKEA